MRAIRERLYRADRAAQLADRLPQPAVPAAVAPPAPPVLSEANPVAGLIVGADGTMFESTTVSEVPSAALSAGHLEQLPRGHPFTLKPLKKWWVDDAGGARPLVAVGGITVQAGLCSLYYDVALVASTVGAMCVIFAGLSAEMALRTTLPQRGQRPLQTLHLSPKDRKRQMVRRAALWLAICVFTYVHFCKRTRPLHLCFLVDAQKCSVCLNAYQGRCCCPRWYTHKAVNASLEWCPASMYSTNSTVMQRWRGPALNRVQCSTTAGPVDILLWPEWSPRGVAHFIELVHSGFFTDVAVYHVVGPMKLVEFGVSGDKKVQRHWDDRPVRDDPPPRDLPTFLEGTLGYAAAQHNARTTQLFFTGFNFNAKSGDAPSMYLSASSTATVTAGASAAVSRQYLAVDRMLPIGRISSGSHESVMTLRTLFQHWDAMRPRVPTLSTLEQHIRTDGNAYVRREFPAVDFIESCQLADAPEGQCGTMVALSGAVVFLSLVACIFILDIEGNSHIAVVPRT